MFLQSDPACLRLRLQPESTDRSADHGQWLTVHRLDGFVMRDVWRIGAQM